MKQKLSTILLLVSFVTCSAVIQDSSYIIYRQVISTLFIKDQIIYQFGGESTSYRIAHTTPLCPNDTFHIDSDTGEIYLIQNISLELDPVCISNGSVSYPVLRTFQCFIIRTDTVQSIGLLLVIHVIPNSNLISLEFSQSIYKANVVGGEINALVHITGSLTAHSVPTEGLVIPTYQLINGNEYFVLKQEVVNCISYAKIVTTTHLNRTFYNLTVRTSHSTTTIVVGVIYNNYYSPQLINAPSTLSIVENTPVGLIITTLQAVDMDEGPGGSVRFQLTGDNEHFMINPITGSIYVISETDYETENNINITVSVYDLGQPQLSIESTIMIFILDANEYTPHINVTSIMSVISESTPIGTTVATIEVRDLDSSNISVHMTSDMCVLCFELSHEVIRDDGSLQYDIILTNALNYEQYSTHTLVILATDNDMPPLSSKETIIFDVRDENELPYFTNGDEISVTISNGEPINAQVVYASAVDEDANDNLTYAIESGNTQQFFSIDSATGLISVARVLDTMLTNLNISVSDSQFSVYTSIIINIISLDYNSPQFVSSIYMHSVPENISITTPVFSFSATDVDNECGGAIRYSIVNVELPYFTLDPVSGLLYVLTEGLLDYETNPSITMTIRATSLGKYLDKFSDTQFTLTITNVNDNTPVIAPIQCPCFMMEEMDSTQFCPALVASDLDEENILEYILVSGDDKFSINSSSGIVSSTSVLDYESNSSYVLYVVASDGEHVSEQVKLVIQVLDINDSPPKYTSDIFLNVPQDTEIGSPLGSVAAYHQDTGYNSLSMYKYSPSNELFYLDPLSGVLYLNGTISSGTSFSFVITANDIMDSTQTTSTNVTISIGENHNIPPRFTLSYDKRFVSRNLPSSSTIAEVTATDETDNIEYELSSDVFSIDTGTGTISLSQSLTGKLSTLYSLNITVRDDGIPSLSNYFVLDVLVYSPNTIVDNIELTQNAGVGVCSYEGYVTEGSNEELKVVTMATSQGGQTIKYAIIGGEFQNSFIVSDHILKTTNDQGIVFDRTQHEAIFITLRAVYGNLFHLCSVTIIIKDINDHGPIFSSSHYSVQIYQSTPVDSSVFQFQATDLDLGYNATTQYTLLTMSTPFSVDSKTGITRLTGPLNQDTYNLNVLATDIQNSSMNDTTSLNVIVLSTSNTAPQFPQIISSITVSENHTMNTSIVTIVASDTDTGVQGQLSYCLMTSTDLFSITTNGELFLIQNLDYETQLHTHNISILSYDQGPNIQTAVASFKILIEDVNDEIPTFLTDTYIASVKEGSNEGVQIITVVAYDSDTGTNGDVQYIISPSDDRFNINSTTGAISTTSNPVNRESLDNDVISLTVVASDQGSVISLSSCVTVNITVIDKNNYRPMFSNTDSQTVQVPESQTLGSVIHTISVIDNDIGLNGELRYTLQGNDSDIFKIDSITGDISLSRYLDYESDSHKYELTITVTDLGEPTLTASQTITFQITNINDNYPTFSHNIYYCTISENPETEQILTLTNETCIVNAIDGDLTDNTISYSIENGDGTFSIDSNGVLTLTTLTGIDYEVNPQYIVHVTAIDSGSPKLSSSAVVIVYLEDDNDLVPLFDDYNTISIPEGLPIGTVLFHSHAIDRDSADNLLSYSILSQTKIFQLNAISGAISLSKLLFYNNFIDQYAIDILASDSEGKSEIQTYGISILQTYNNPAAPQFSSSLPLVLSISISTPIGTVIVTMVTIDPDDQVDNTVQYYIIGPANGVGYFSINETSGEIYVSSSLLPVIGQELNLIILAVDSGSPPLSSTYELNIILIDDPASKPYFTSPVYDMFVSESQSNEDYIIGHVSALVNGGIESDVCYSLGNNSQQVPFDVNTSTGAIYVTGSLDRETEHYYMFTVEAYRPDIVGISIAMVTMEVEDVNDFVPSFQIPFSEICLFSTYPVGVNHTILRMFTVDKDDGINSISLYSLIPENTPFNINSNTGEIYLTSIPSGDYNLTIIANNPPLQQRELDITISITNPITGNNDIVCNNDTVIIPEDTNIGTAIHTLSVSDTLKHYSIQKTPEDSYNVFAIHPSSGVIYLTTSLDRETQDSYNIYIDVWDGVSNVVTCLLTVSISDINDNIPIFSESLYSFSVYENAPPGTIIGTVNVTDLDIDGPFHFDIIDSQDHTSMMLFGINSTGNIVVSEMLDKEELQTQHVLTISVADDGIPQLNNFVRVNIEILDVNDNPPQFIYPIPNITILENCSEASTVFIINTFDPDEEGSVRYILHNIGSDPFVINDTTGEITTSGPLDYETVSEYELQVLASDTTDVSVNYSTYLYISVYNVIDTLPILSEVDSVLIPENQIPYTFVTILSNSNPHAVIYSIINGNELEHFVIEPFTGVIRTLVPLDYEAITLYNLTIRGSFNNEYYSEKTITVQVIDQNDNPPETTPTNLTFQLSENSSTLTEIAFDLGFHDADSGINAIIKTAVILDSIANEYFQINTSGEVTLKQKLDRETKEVYQFEIIVTDSGTPPLYSTYIITVFITDDNDNSPVFSHQTYEFTISAPVLVNEPLVSVLATDNDEGPNAEITYTLLSGSEKFYIESQTGRLGIHDNFNLESVYTLLVKASDTGGLNDTAMILITIRYCSFNSLAFQPAVHTVYIPEDSPINSKIITPILNEFDRTGSYVFHISMPTRYFNISSTNGEVFVKESLDRETQSTHNLIIQVIDTTSFALRIAELTLFIIVTDVNDNPPVFINTPYASFVSDDSRIGSQVFQLAIEDPDEGINSEVVYSITTDSDSFAINHIRGIISVAQSLDGYNHGSVIEIAVEATNEGEPPLKSNTTVRITIVNSNAPNFSQDIYTATIPESTLSDSIIISVYATSSSQNSILFYSIVNTNDPKFPFSIDPNSGNITLNDRGVDYEQLSLYSFFVDADDITNGLSTRVQVEISISDVNDESPVFSEALYIVDVDENILENSTIVNTIANDLDTAPNAQITYSLESNNLQFRIDSTTGIISNIMSFDFETQTTYEFIVFATDSGAVPLEGSSTVRVIINNINDNAPVLDNITGALLVSEIPDPGTLVTLISASDPDNDDIIYDLDGSDNFEISIDGLLRVTHQQDVILTEPQYTLIITANDGKYTVNTSITIQVLDINDNSPVFNQSIYYANVTENSSPGVYIVTVYATDADRGSNAAIQYSGHLEYFSVDSSTGVVTTACNDSDCVIDRETNEVYNLIVIARDGGDRTDTAVVMISVLDVNDNNPKFTQDTFAVYIPEESDDGTFVITVTATDPDEGLNGTITYEIVNKTNTLPFVMNSDTGQVTILGETDHDTQPTWTFIVMATDGGGLTSNTATVIVNLTDIADENPQFSQSVYYINVIENTIPMTPVLTANVTYPEMCFSQSFSIFVAEGVPFTIDNDGVIRVGSETLDRESEDMYSFNIIVECLYYLGLDLTFNPIFDSRFDSAEIRVTITDDNEVPSFPSNHYVGTVSETAPLNTTVLIITATDHDLGDNGEIRYRISDDMLIPSFDIEPVSGVVFVSDSLDHETDELHVFEIDAFDLGTPSLSASVTVIVAILDDNDSPSTFVCDAPDNICIFNVSIPENTPTNASIITLRTSDPDDVGTISFQLTSSDFLVTSSESSDVITEGIIRTSGPLDRETQDSYTFEVIVSDGIHTDTSLLIVNITDINDEYPVFQDENFEVGIRENYPTHVIFTSVNATDKDEGVNAEITYTILDSPLINTISINSTTGDVFFLVSPDYEESNRIELNIQATDTGGLQDFATMVINILDENDNAPVFSEVNYTATIYENLPDGTDVRYVVATDRDSDLNGLVTYSLGNESNEYFQINPTTGLIKSKAPVNKEANDSFVLIVTAKDLGQDPLSVESTVLITVLDVNDNAPEFSSPSYTAEISEEASIGTIVLTVYVTDIDEGSNAKLIFDLTGPNNDDFIYEVIPNGVNITVAQNLNHESISEYQLSLRAIDGGIPSQESAVSISIYVIDENDNTPSFQFPKYKYEVPENTAIGSIIGTVSAVDFDSKDSNLTYSFLNHVDDFSINYQTGEISVRYQLDHENVIEYIFTVIAKEQRAIPNTAQTIVEITIQDINDNPPEFICTQNSLCPMRNLSIYENKHPNVLETFHVRDLDSVTNINAITFDIGSGDTDEEGNTLFSIDPLSGELSVLVSLDREAREVYYIEVTATDNGVPSLVGTSHVTLIVKDVNDNHPVGKEQHVYAYMKDGRLGSTNFGRIAFSDKDIANNHLFTIQNLPSSFVVDTQGQLSIDSSSLTPNIYELTVVINDTLYNDTIVSTTSIVTIEVKNVSMETEDDTITMLISDMTPEVFITEHLILFQTEVTSLLLEIVDDFTSLFVYSITKSLYSYNTTELSLSAILHDKTYLHKDILKYLLHIYRGGIESSTSISILTEDLDFCSMEPCSFNGLCFVDIQYELPTIIINKHTTTVYHGLQPERQVQCTCVAGHTGLTCSDNQSSCDENTCHNGAHCIDIPYVTGCLCTQGYIGESCDISYPSHDLCTPSPCSNGATCTYSDVGYTCTCPTGFTGKTCNTSTDTELYGCYGNPCLHGAECIWDDLSISSYYCNCSSDYKGTRCQTFIYDCSSECDGCVYSPIGSTCITTPITCNELECPLTSSCVQDGNKAVCIDDCNPNPCQNGGQCVYQSPGYYCVCSLKYSGLNCELTTATFNGSSYALFPSLPLVSNGVISLDFITEDEDGVLLFTGRVDTQTNDYLLLHIKNGSVECVISFGGEPSTLRINDFSVNDQYWYTVTIFYSPMVIHFVKYTCTHSSMLPHQYVRHTHNTYNIYLAIYLAPPHLIRHGRVT